jgi:dGTPase
MPPPDDTLFDPLDPLEREERLLAPYAMRTRASRGRRHPEPPHSFRSLYTRDRDRIVHSTAFRRLMYKTQVVITQTQDHHRTRLTHTLEVAQISRTIARQLGLNEDLTEAIALAHDVGHPPFGHAGEEALNECMSRHGGFEHNRHGLRILELLEHRYAAFPGLNLSWEVLEAQAHHSKRGDIPQVHEYIVSPQPLLEAQVVDAADSLAYDTHDVDDALNLGLVTTADMMEVPFWRETAERVLPPQRRSVEDAAAVVRALIDRQVLDLLEHTRRRLLGEGIRTVEEVRRCAAPLAGPGPEVRQLKQGLEEFLRRRVYQHHRVERMSAKGRRIVRMLFEEFCRTPRLLPERYARRAEQAGVEQTVCDYLAGMTDRFAQDEFLRLFQPYTLV